MKILLFGANGQLGFELIKSLQLLGTLKTYNHQQADFENTDLIRAIINNNKPDVIINAAAYTAVDHAENNREKAYQVNARAVKVISEQVRKIDAWLIHYSTDYVFDGKTNKPYKETDITNPLSVYGKTKLQGEKFILESGCKHLTFRTGWIYGYNGNNFLKKILDLAQNREEFEVVADQIGTPTSAKFIANKSAECLEKIFNGDLSRENISGLYHLTPYGSISWHGFARFIVERVNSLGLINSIVSNDKISPIKTSEYPQLATRPLYSVLNSEKLSKTFGVNLLPWQSFVDEVLNEIYL